MYYFIDLNNDDKIFGRPMDAKSVSQSDKSNLEKKHTPISSSKQ